MSFNRKSESYEAKFLENYWNSFQIGFSKLAHTHAPDTGILISGPVRDEDPMCRAWPESSCLCLVSLLSTPQLYVEELLLLIYLICLYYTIESR